MPKAALLATGAYTVGTAAQALSKAHSLRGLLAEAVMDGGATAAPSPSPKVYTSTI